MHFCVHKHHHRFLCAGPMSSRRQWSAKIIKIFLVDHYRFETIRISGPARICHDPVRFLQLEHGTASRPSWSNFTLFSPPLTHNGCHDADLCCLWCPRSITTLPEHGWAKTRAYLLIRTRPCSSRAVAIAQRRAARRGVVEPFRALSAMLVARSDRTLIGVLLLLLYAIPLYPISPCFHKSRQNSAAGLRSTKNRYM